ncbi:MAG: SLBB domain-containing protein, partial [Candidatus Margulisbacteria bacterium]|nr:SLBB domain-containing protein [Candidatus Margulisiibacteriota bacterium]
MKKSISSLLICVLVAQATPLFAISIDSFGLSVPNIQDVQVSEQSGPKSAGDLVLEAPIDEEHYLLGPGDMLSIHLIVGNADLSIDHDLLIGADGKIYFPKLGEMYLSGISLKQAKKEINARIARYYRGDYKLSVLLSQPKKVKIYIAGMVKNPGPLAVYDSLRVSEVISQAGGVASGASNRYVYIRRTGEGGKQEMLMADLFAAYRDRDLSKDIRIRSGDVIEVPDASNILISLEKNDENDKLLFEGRETFVYVYGEVTKSGRFEYIPGKRLSDYISFAGGPTPRALLSGTTISRFDKGQRLVNTNSQIAFGAHLKGETADGSAQIQG